MAIDRELLTERVTKSGERPSYSLVPPDPEGYSPDQLFEFNVKKAQALLAEAGFPNGEGFPEFELLYNTQDNHRKVALAIQQMLAENLNIRVTLANQEWKVYLNTKRNLQHQIARAGWIADYLDPSNFFDVLLSYSGNNDTGWKNSEYDSLIQKLKETSDSAERESIYDKLNTILIEEMPVIPIYLYSDLNLVSKEVKGWYDNVMHYHSYNRVYLEATE
jgi:oligopeptide transport system substrate-binding protein